jgi:hypothetical protein
VILEFSLPPAPSEGGGDVFGVAPPPSEGAGGRLKQQEKPILWTIYIHHYNPLQSAIFKIVNVALSGYVNLLLKIPYIRRCDFDHRISEI